LLNIYEASVISINNIVYAAGVMSMVIYPVKFGSLSIKILFMKPFLKFTVLIFFTGVLFHVSCKKEKSCEGSRKGNKPPIANAGSDHPDGKISDPIAIGWLWTKISGAASFNINNTAEIKLISQ